MLDETNLPAIPAEAPTQVDIDHLPHKQGRMIPDSFLPLGPEDTVQVALAALPNGFIADEDGLYAVEHDDGEVRYHLLCAPLIVEGKAHTSSGSDWSTCIRFRDQDGTVVSCTLPDSDILCKVTAVVADLVQKGLKVAYGKKLHAALGQLLLEWKTDRRSTFVDQYGWTDASCRAFVLADGKIEGIADVLPMPHLIGMQAAQTGSKGTLEDWTSEISVRALSNPLMMTAISVSLSGPLLQPLGMEGVVFIFMAHRLPVSRHCCGLPTRFGRVATRRRAGMAQKTPLSILPRIIPDVCWHWMKLERPTRAQLARLPTP